MHVLCNATVGHDTRERDMCQNPKPPSSAEKDCLLPLCEGETVIVSDNRVSPDWALVAAEESDRTEGTGAIARHAPSMRRLPVNPRVRPSQALVRGSNR